MRAPRTVLSFALLGLALSCSGSGDDVADETIPLDLAAERYGQAYCERLLECSAIGVALLSQSSCEQAVWQYRNDTLALLDDQVAAGRIAYDDAAMARCLADVRDLPCADLSTALLTDVGRCADAIRGQVAAGAACDDSLECQAGLYCDTAAGCPGTCQPRVVAGAACTDAEACAAGLDCDTTCQAYGRAGAACGDTGLPACAFGFECDGAPGVCQPLTFTAALGAACDPDTGSLCQAGLTCAVTDLQQRTYACQPMSAAGASCGRGIPNPCPSGQTCVVASGQLTGTCTAQGGAGQPCLSGVLFGCAPGLDCDSATSTCVVLVDNGESCTVADQCANACTGGVCGEPAACD